MGALTGQTTAAQMQSSVLTFFLQTMAGWEMSQQQQSFVFPVEGAARATLPRKRAATAKKRMMDGFGVCG